MLADGWTEGGFGVCPDDEDLLFVISSEHHVLWQADILPKLAKIGSEGSMPVPDLHQGLQENMYVYRLKEIRETARRNGRAMVGYVLLQRLPASAQ